MKGGNSDGGATKWPTKRTSGGAGATNGGDEEAGSGDWKVTKGGIPDRNNTLAVIFGFDDDSRNWKITSDDGNHDNSFFDLQLVQLHSTALGGLASATHDVRQHSDSGGG